MPMKPKRPCAVPGCPELTDKGSYCTKHYQEENHWYNKFGRTKEEKKRYGSAWRKIRNEFLLVHPLCMECKREYKATIATEVHHIKPLDHGGTNETSNLVALCKSCHSKITAASGDRWNKNKIYAYDRGRGSQNL